MLLYSFRDLELRSKHGKKLVFTITLNILPYFPIYSKLFQTRMDDILACCDFILLPVGIKLLLWKFSFKQDMQGVTR